MPFLVGEMRVENWHLATRKNSIVKFLHKHGSGPAQAPHSKEGGFLAMCSRLITLNHKEEEEETKDVPMQRLRYRLQSLMGMK